MYNLKNRKLIRRAIPPSEKERQTDAMVETHTDRQTRQKECHFAITPHAIIDARQIMTIAGTPACACCPFALRLWYRNPPGRNLEAS